MVKKTKRKKHISHNNTHILLKKGLVVYSILVFFTFALVAISASAIVYGKNVYSNNQRYEKITAVFDKMSNSDVIDKPYYEINRYVFGEKREREGVFYLPSILYTHDNTVSGTWNEIDQIFENDGFKLASYSDLSSKTGSERHYTKDDVTVSVMINNYAWALLTLFDKQSDDTAMNDDSGPVLVKVSVDPGYN